MKMLIQIVVPGIICIFFPSLFVIPQTLPESTLTLSSKSERKKLLNNNPNEKQRITSCEQSIHIFDQSLYRALEDKSSLIIIFRRGENEKNKFTNERMSILENLCRARGYEGSCAIAIGSPIDGLGRADFYVKGNLFETAYYERNTKSFCSKP